MTKTCPHCHATVLSTSQPERCPICDWPMANDQSKGCIPGDCSYRPDDPAEQERIRKRRAAIAVMPDRYTVDDPWSRPAMPAGTQGALALYLNEVKPVDGRVQLINISVDELSVLRRLTAATPAIGGEPQSPHGNFTERAIKLITEAAGHRDDWGKYEYAIIDLAREADAAQPASPLRGMREALEKILQRLSGPASAQLWDIRQIAEGALAAQPAQAAAGGDALLLMQARYVLLNLNAERPGCGYDKLADACEAAGLSEALVQPAQPAVGGERQRIARILAEKLWSGATFDQGLDSEKEAFLNAADAVLAPLASPLRGREITDEMLNSHLKATAEWVDPYEAATECGVPIECGITQDDADELNAQSRASLRVGYAAAFASPPEQPAAAGKLACRRCGGWGTIMLGNGDRETCELCHGTTIDPDQQPAADPIGQSMDEAAADNFGLTVDDLDEGDDE